MRSTNWYAIVGDMIIAGCQMEHVIQSDTCQLNNTERVIEHEGAVSTHKIRSYIQNKVKTQFSCKFLLNLL